MVEYTYRPSLLKSHEILDKWQILKPHIESANEYSAGEMAPFDMALLAMVEKAHIWLTVDQDDNIASVIVTRFIQQTRRKTMLIQSCGGSIGGWAAWGKQHHDTLVDFAKSTGCDSIQVWGRKGWERRLRHIINDAGHSYELLYHVYNMEI